MMESSTPRLANRINLDAHLDEQRQKEYEALEKEFAWLLENEYTQKVEVIDKCVEECLKKFSTVLHPAVGAEQRPILLSSPQQGDTVFCVAAVSGDKISKALSRLEVDGYALKDHSEGVDSFIGTRLAVTADTGSEITLKLPGRGSKPLKTFIKEHAAVKLRQIQDSANFFQQARDKFHEIKQSKDSLRTPEEIQESFSGLCSSLRASEEMLIVPQLPNVRELYTAENRSHMKPELPEDLAVHFHISSVYLVLTVVTVAQTARRPSTMSQGQKSTANEYGSQWIGTTFDYGASTFEVVNELQVKSKVPWLTGVLKLLQEIQELAQDLIDKVTLFRALGLPRK